MNKNLKNNKSRKILFVLNEDGFGPSALSSYIVKKLLSERNNWKIDIWNNNCFDYNTRLYKHQIESGQIKIEGIDNLLKLIKQNGRINKHKTIKILESYLDKSHNNNIYKNDFTYDLIVDFGVPGIVKQASILKIKTLSIFDHSWSKSLEDILKKTVEESKSENLLKIEFIISKIKAEESLVQELILFPDYLTPKSYVTYWENILNTHVDILPGVLGGNIQPNVENSNKYKFNNDNATILIQGGNTLAWDLILKYIAKDVQSNIDLLEKNRINLLIYIPNEIEGLSDFDFLKKRKCKYMKILEPINDGTIQSILSTIKFIVTRAGAGTVNDAIACRIPFVCVEEPEHTQVDSILESCLNRGLTRKLLYKDFLNAPLDNIIKEFNKKDENKSIVKKMKKINTGSENAVTQRIIEIVES